MCHERTKKQTATFHPAKKEFDKQVASLDAGIEDCEQRLKVADQKVANLWEYIAEYGKSTDGNQKLERARRNRDQIEKELREIEGEDGGTKDRLTVETQV